MRRMSLREVQEVARRAADGGYSPRGGGPTVHGVADALGLAPADVEVLLDVARQGGRPVRDLKVVLGVVALVAAFLLGLGTTFVTGSHARAVASSVPSAMAPSSAGALPDGTRILSRTGEPTLLSNTSPVGVSNSPSIADPGRAETKTGLGNLGRAVDEARRSGTRVAQGGEGGGTKIAMAAETPAVSAR